MNECFRDYMPRDYRGNNYIFALVITTPSEGAFYIPILQEDLLPEVRLERDTIHITRRVTRSILRY
jgi:hypothetical protein